MPSAELIQRVRGRAGTVLNGKWRLETVLGVGGMAAVYSAVHRNQSRVAIKVLHPELSLDTGVRTRFLREGYVANTVDHSGAVRVFDDDLAEDGSAFLVMELLIGETLEERAERKGGTLPPGEVLAAADELLDVLAAAHDKGIIHRDIKPDNLFVTREGRLKVLDFGIARVRELSQESGGGTAAGIFLGTPAFMAPEQARGRWDEVDTRSDIWAVGATMFSLLSGRNVHEAKTLNEQLVLAVTDRAPSLRRYVPDLPDSVITLVDQALQQEKSQRWPSVRHMREQLREAMSDVEAPRSLSAPNPWLKEPRVEHGGATLAAPPQLISSITGSTPATASRPPPSRILPLLLIGGGVFAATVIAAAVGWWLLDRPQPVTVTPPLISADSPAPALASGAAPELPEPAQDEPNAPPADSADPSRALASRQRVPEPRARLGVVKPTVLRPAETAQRTAPSESAAAKPAPPPSAAPPRENPFDRRF